MTSCSLSSTFPQKKCSLVREHMETHCHLKGSLLRKMFQLFSRPCCIGRNDSTFPVCLPEPVISLEHLNTYCGSKFTKNKNDQWSSAARVSASRCTNPWYMIYGVPLTIREPRQFCLNCAGLWLWVVWGFRTVQIPLACRHWYFRAQHSFMDQFSKQKITSKTNTEPPKCHWLPATKIHNASKSCSRQTTTSTKSMGRHKRSYAET